MTWNKLTAKISELIYYLLKGIKYKVGYVFKNVIMSLKQYFDYVYKSDSSQKRKMLNRL